MESKKVWQSKTNWVALISAVVAFIPAVNSYIVNHPTEYAMILSGVFSGLRIISKGKIEIL